MRAMMWQGCHRLAWTSVGTFFHRIFNSPGKGNMTITGNLGTVMKESATIALNTKLTPNY
jgi:ATP-dependent Lon protease